MNKQTVTYILQYGEQHPQFQEAYKQNVKYYPEKYPQLTCLWCDELFTRSVSLLCYIG